jgi:hypothetical protein
LRRPGPRWSALDGALPQLRYISTASLAPIAGGEERGSLSRSLLAAALSTACEGGERPLTLSVVPRSRPGLPARPGSRHRGPLSPRPRQRVRLPRPRTPSIDRCSLRVCFRRARIGGSPPPVSRLCRRGPGFRHAFAAPMLSPGTTRPDVGSGSSSLPDATGHAPPVDFCNLLRSASTSDGSSEPRAPRSWSPTCAAVFRTTAFRRWTECGWPCVLRQGQPSVHGPGAGSSGDPPIECSASSRRDRSRWELHPNPIDSDTSCR